MDLRRASTAAWIGALLLAAGLGLGCSRKDQPRPEGPGGTGEAGSAGGTGDSGSTSGGTSHGSGTGDTGTTGGADPDDAPGDPGPGDSDTEDPAPAVACGTTAGWDLDGDGISDAIERNNAESGYQPFHQPGCDDDPSRPRGSYYAGKLEGSVNLSDRGPGYVHNRGGDPVDGDDWGSLALLSCLETVGREWEATGRELNVNDLSQRGGGRFRPHRSHQNGLDVDLRYVRRDGKSYPLDIRRDPEAYDQAATQALMKLILDACDVEVIFADLAPQGGLGFDHDELGAKPGKLLYCAGHSNHFHLRLKPPSAAGGSP